VIGLPTLAQLDAAAATAPVRIWLASEPADMRCGFDRLAELARRVTGQDPLSGHLFLFRSRGGDRLKALYWDRDGLALWYKRLEEGTFKLPRIEAGATSVELRPSELAMLLDGIDLRSVKRVRRYQRPGSPPP
jgi:transposase